MPPAMAKLHTPADIERLAGKAGKSIAQVCREARVAQSTFSRWKGGKTEPTLDVYRRLVAVVTPPRKAAIRISAPVSTPTPSAEAA